MRNARLSTAHKHIHVNKPRTGPTHSVLALSGVWLCDACCRKRGLRIYFCEKFYDCIRYKLILSVWNIFKFIYGLRNILGKTLYLSLGTLSGRTWKRMGMFVACVCAIFISQFRFFRNRRMPFGTHVISMESPSQMLQCVDAWWPTQMQI